ncbi:ribonuclease H-like domain-containing protein [Corynebacterium sp. H113]|uniref:ribonuclease H-like domain-containing protein n=1 Tax=Corynebacterium sp. H113 TaxID=3133419 RepID=UPI0030A0ABED
MTPLKSLAKPVTGSDLIGCRYRLVRDLWEYQGKGQVKNAVEESRSHHKDAVLAAIPHPIVIQDGPDADLETLEAMAAGAPFIIGAVLRHERPPATYDAAGRAMNQRAFSGIAEESRPDLLVKIDDAPQTHGPRYMPVLIVAHKLLSPHKGRAPAAKILPLTRLAGPGVFGRTMRQGIVATQKWRLRHHGPDAVRLGQAAALLHRLGVSSGLVGGIGADGENIVVVDEGPRVASYRAALRDARETVYAVTGEPSRWEVGRWPLAARKVRECKGCRWHDACDEELRHSDDISLLLPGDRASKLREQGISTVRELAAADNCGEQSWLARAVLADIPALRRVDVTSAPRADVEIDIDMEAYPSHGAYLWGAWPVGEDYQPFVTWAAPGDKGLGGQAEAQNFALFWTWLMKRCNDALRAGKSVRVYCWAAEGENYWLRQSADRFGGMEFVVDGAIVGDRDGENSEGKSGEGSTVIRVPLRSEIDEFISSDMWTDMFRVTKSQLLSPHGMGLKVVAPMAGFHWRDEGVDGEMSLTLYEQAVGLAEIAPTVAESARAALLRYNGDDCRSVAHIRDWLDSGQATQEIPHGSKLPKP